MCSDNNNNQPVLPKAAYLPINRCNLPAKILGGLTFQHHPTTLLIDGVKEFHSDLFKRLNSISNAEARQNCFMDYMTVHFCLEELEEQGYSSDMRHNRANANYLRVIRGWMFDANSREGAVLKGWVESRFGLTPRYHLGPIRHHSNATHRIYEQERASGLYNTNALEAQLDLLYSYSQYELNRLIPRQTHITVYRGINNLYEYEVIGRFGKNRQTVLLNNINSFSSNHERADEFGDQLIVINVPIEKIFFYSGLLPRALQGEDEYVVIGGLYEAAITLSLYKKHHHSKTAPTPPCQE